MRNFPSVLEKIADLNINQIEGLLSLANKFKRRENYKYEPSLFLGRQPIVANSFLENSTRTKNSFALAIQRLGCTYLDFNTETSSLKKGESLDQTLLTLFAQGVDLCVIRSSVSKELETFKNNPPIRIINGGDGIHEHPTQALLDLMTIRDHAMRKENLELADSDIEVDIDSFKVLKGKKISIIGDCKHSRVTHSLIALLPQFGMQVNLCGPEFFHMSQRDIEHYAQKNQKMITQTTSLDQSLEDTDYIYLLRIQKERHLNKDISSPTVLKTMQDYHKLYGLSLEKFEKLGQKIPVLHPGPANIGVELCQKLIDSNHYYGHEQVVNSVYMRMAIITAILKNGDKNVGCINNVPIR